MVTSSTDRAAKLLHTIQLSDPIIHHDIGIWNPPVATGISDNFKTGLMLKCLNI